MTDNQLQEKINIWWQSLTPEQRGEFWEPGMRWGKNGEQLLLLLNKSEAILYKIGDSHIWAQSRRDFLLYDNIPTPCNAFWWKLIDWLLGVGIYHILIDCDGHTGVYAHISAPDEEGYDEGKKDKIEHNDRRHALLDAAIQCKKDK